MDEAITDALSSIQGSKIQAIVLDSEAPRELGQITNQLAVSDPSSYHWLVHDYLVLAPSIVSVGAGMGDYSSSWRYQLLERFRTDMTEFHPIYHSTVAFRGSGDGPSSTPARNQWIIGVLRAGNPRFYDHLLASLDAIRGNTDAAAAAAATDFEEVVLVETKTGAISHIPDYQPSKWATPSDYDLEPAKQQWSEQRPVGVQLVVQFEKSPIVSDVIEDGTEVLFYREIHDDWCLGRLIQTFEDEEDETLQYVAQSDDEEIRTVERNDIIPFDSNDLATGTIPFGTMVLADGEEEGLAERVFYTAQIIGTHKDGRYRVYYLNDGSFAYLDKTKVVPHNLGGGFPSTSDARMFSSCSDFEEMFDSEDLTPKWNEDMDDDSYDEMDDDSGEAIVFRREIGDGCLVAKSWPLKSGGTTTIVGTYDGQIHVDLNVYTPKEAYKQQKNNFQLVVGLSKRDLDGTERIQTDFHPRGYGRVVNFDQDLQKPHFGTKYPRKIE